MPKACPLFCPIFLHLSVTFHLALLAIPSLNALILALKLYTIGYPISCISFQLPSTYQEVVCFWFLSLTMAPIILFP